VTRLRIAVSAVVLAFLGAGAALGWLAQAKTGSDTAAGPKASITNVTSGASGSGGPQERKGVQSVPPPTSQAVKSQRIKGTDGIATEQKNTIRPVSDTHGSIQSIRGIEGIDTVHLENLEAVLRMQSRVTEPQSNRNARAAAALTATETTEEPTEEIPDGREEHLEFNLEGS